MNTDFFCFQTILFKSHRTYKKGTAIAVPFIEVMTPHMGNRDGYICSDTEVGWDSSVVHENRTRGRDDKKSFGSHSGCSIAFLPVHR